MTQQVMYVYLPDDPVVGLVDHPDESISTGIEKVLPGSCCQIHRILILNLGLNNHGVPVCLMGFVSTFL